MKCSFLAGLLFFFFFLTTNVCFVNIYVGMDGWEPVYYIGGTAFFCYSSLSMQRLAATQKWDAYEHLSDAMCSRYSVAFVCHR